ncbi:Bor/Iss family lipoprotein [Halioxenophilus aromaticivorans]|uniref:Uncharacterized protein n=1 Tax=Halioxenophilus aromaticivorans TaxID=1306992 RepID=A0AAV3U499_9ALTE
MLNKTIYTALSTLCILISGCSTMHFVNGPETEEKSRSHWHHSAIYGAFEISPPYDIAESCYGKEWNKITIERTLLNSLASFGINGVNLYTPWSVHYSCRLPVDQLQYQDDL